MNRRMVKKVHKAARGSTALAIQLGLTKQAIDKWKKLPPVLCLAVELISGISRYELRADIYGSAAQS